MTARSHCTESLLFRTCAVVLLLPTALAFLPFNGLFAAHAKSGLVPLPPMASGLPANVAASPRPQAGVASSVRSRAARLLGNASWYGSVLSGHRTASGELFDPQALTACHPTLPFGTMVRVVNLRNGKSVTVRINDRGILNADRVIDLSTAAADELGMLRAGVAPVRLEVQKMLHLRAPEPAATPSSAPDPAPAAPASAQVEMPGAGSGL